MLNFDVMNINSKAVESVIVEIIHWNGSLTCIERNH
jgi:hypothetical protein